MTDGEPTGRAARIDRAIDGWFRSVTRRYEHGLVWALQHRRVMLGVTIGTVVLTFFLYGAVPKGFLSEQDTGLLRGTTIAAPSVSFAEMSRLQQNVVDVILRDPAVAQVASSVGVVNGDDQPNQGEMLITLKPRAERHTRAVAVIARLRPELAKLPGLATTLFAAGDFGGGGNKGSGGQYSLNVLDDDLGELQVWTSRIAQRLRQEPGFLDVSSDQDQGAPEARLVIDRLAASRLRVSATAIDTALGNSVAQRQISTIYDQRNQYSVVLETLPWLQRDPKFLDHIYVGADDGRQIPLNAVAHLSYGTAALNVVHEAQTPATEITYNLKPGMAVGDATKAAQAAIASIGAPQSLRIDFGGNARWALQSLESEPALIGAALLSIYIVLGILYESLIHPITILSSLPSAGLGALLAVLVTGTDFGVLSIIGIVLLMGIVKKNAIMLVDFALDAERERGMNALDAIHEACIERFRPIIMTTLTAICGSLPLALAFGTGSELRRPLGIAIVGGLIVSQALTLYTTPVVYLMLERRVKKQRVRIIHAAAE